MSAAAVNVLQRKPRALLPFAWGFRHGHPFLPLTTVTLPILQSPLPCHLHAMREPVSDAQSTVSMSGPSLPIS